MWKVIDRQASYIHLFLISLVVRSLLSCSPPRSAHGEFSMKQMSTMQRTEKAKILLIGTVLELTEDRLRRAMTAQIAVHMKLKGEKVKQVIHVTGFGAKSSFTDTHVDCTDTVVELYGSYLFFLRKDAYGLYYIDEIDMQPAALQIPCKRKISKRVRRILKKYRRLRNNSVQCNDLMKSRTNRSRKCLRTKTLKKYFKDLKYRNINPRTTYCNLQKLRNQQHSVKDSRNQIMRDDIKQKQRPALKKSLSRPTPSSSLWKQQKWFQNSKQTNILIYSNSQNFIIQPKKSSEKDTQKKQDRTLKNAYKKWRLIEKATKVKKSGDNVIYLQCIVFAVSLFISMCL